MPSQDRVAAKLVELSLPVARGEEKSSARCAARDKVLWGPNTTSYTCTYGVPLGPRAGRGSSCTPGINCSPGQEGRPPRSPGLSCRQSERDDIPRVWSTLRPAGGRDPAQPPGESEGGLSGSARRNPHARAAANANPDIVPGPSQCEQATEACYLFRTQRCVHRVRRLGRPRCAALVSCGSCVASTCKGCRAAAVATTSRPFVAAPSWRGPCTGAQGAGRGHAGRGSGDFRAARCVARAAL